MRPGGRVQSPETSSLVSFECGATSKRNPLVTNLRFLRKINNPLTVVSTVLYPFNTLAPYQHKSISLRLSRIRIKTSRMMSTPMRNEKGEIVVTKATYKKIQYLAKKEGLIRQTVRFVNDRQESQVHHIYVGEGNALFATPGMMTIIKEFFGEAHVEHEYTKLIYKPVEAMVIPDASIMSHLINSVSRIEEMTLVEAGTPARLNIANLFAIISILPGMKDVYTDYLLDHDDDLAVSDDQGMISPKPIELYDEDKPKPPVHTKSFLMISAAVTLYLLVKSFDKDHPNHLNDYLGNRVKALAFQLGPAAASIEAGNIRGFLRGDLASMSTIMGHYPKIKQAIFPRVVYGRNMILTHVKDILRGSQLTLITMISEFLRAEEPTKLHVYQPVIQEIKMFLQEWVQIKNKYGEDWPFFKLIDPHGVATSSRKYSKIGSAAFAWQLVTSGQDSLERLKSVAKNETYMALARIKLPRGILATETFDISLFLREMHAEGFLTSIKQQVKWSDEGELIPEDDEV